MSSAGNIVLDTQKAYLNKGTYLVSVFRTISSTAKTTKSTLVFDKGEHEFAQNMQNTHNRYCQVVLYKAKESKEYTQYLIKLRGTIQSLLCITFLFQYHAKHLIYICLELEYHIQ